MKHYIGDKASIEIFEEGTGNSIAYSKESNISDIHIGKSIEIYKDNFKVNQFWNNNYIYPFKVYNINFNDGYTNNYNKLIYINIIIPLFERFENNQGKQVGELTLTIDESLIENSYMSDYIIIKPLNNKDYGLNTTIYTEGVRE